MQSKGLKVGMIWAEALTRAIGREGVMPWHLPEDLAHFKEQTSGLPVIMGRRTWESLPERFRPLPGRQNTVVTRNPDFVAAGATTAASLEAALADIASAGAASVGSAATGLGVDVWILGGGELYRQAMPIASFLSVTKIFVEITDADTFAPEIGPEWHKTKEGQVLQSRTGLSYRFDEYERVT